MHRCSHLSGTSSSHAGWVIGELMDSQPCVSPHIIAGTVQSVRLLCRHPYTPYMLQLCLVHRFTPAQEISSDSERHSQEGTATLRCIVHHSPPQIHYAIESATYAVDLTGPHRRLCLDCGSYICPGRRPPTLRLHRLIPRCPSLCLACSAAARGLQILLVLCEALYGVVALRTPVLRQVSGLQSRPLLLCCTRRL